LRGEAIKGAVKKGFYRNFWKSYGGEGERRARGKRKRFCKKILERGGKSQRGKS